MNCRHRSISLGVGLWTAAWTLLGLSPRLAAQDRARQIDELIGLYAGYGQFNGTALVAERGKVIYKKGTGFANMEWKIPNRPETKFRIGSITKSFTAFLILQLAEQGKIRLEGKVSDYLPDYRKDIGERVTIHHLLTQTSGIQEFFQLPGFYEEAGRDRHGVEEFVKKYCGRWLRFEPGTRFEFSNSGYYLLGAVIERITGRSYEQALKAQVLDPLGMKDTGLDDAAAIITNRAAGYEKTMGGYINTPYLDMSVPYAAGALYSTVEDLSIWDLALADDRLLGKEFKALLFRPYVEALGARYGYGWVIDKKKLSGSPDEVSCIWHGGVVHGFNSLMERYVDDGHLIILLNNTGTTYLYDLAAGVRDILYGRPYRRPGKSVAEALQATLAVKGVGAAIEQYQELKERRSGEYNFHVFELYRLGSGLLGKNRIKDAIAIFELNAKAHPGEPIVYDCLGQAYARSGDKWLAIKNYGKSLELDPGNIQAIERMRELLREE